MLGGRRSPDPQKNLGSIFPPLRPIAAENQASFPPQSLRAAPNFQQSPIPIRIFLEPKAMFSRKDRFSVFVLSKVVFQEHFLIFRDGSKKISFPKEDFNRFNKFPPKGGCRHSQKALRGGSPKCLHSNSHSSNPVCIPQFQVLIVPLTPLIPKEGAIYFAFLIFNNVPLAPFKREFLFFSSPKKGGLFCISEPRDGAFYLAMQGGHIELSSLVPPICGCFERCGSILLGVFLVFTW